jgi:hypothetical protein
LVVNGGKFVVVATAGVCGAHCKQRGGSKHFDFITFFHLQAYYSVNKNFTVNLHQQTQKLASPNRAISLP